MTPTRSRTAPRPRTAGGRPAWLVLATTELALLVRNRTALLTATATPLGFAAFLMLLTERSSPRDAAGVAALQMLMLLGFTVFVAATLILTSRREQLYLKRLRSSPASTAAIVGGLTAPLVALLVGQAAVVLAATAVFTGIAPARPALLVASALAGCLTCIGLAFLTAAVTRTPEAAQYTTFPGFLALMGGAIWVNLTPAADVHPLQLVVPGAAVAQLTRYGWDPVLPAGTGLAEVVITPLVGAVVVAAVAAWAGARTFRWEPRA